MEIHPYRSHKSLGKNEIQNEMQNEIRSHGIYAGEKSNSFFTLCFLTPMEMMQPHLTENLKIGRFLRIQTPPLLTL